LTRSGSEVDLHRLTVDEALPRLDEFLYGAFREGQHRVWVVHGKGTGVLRQEVRRYLSGHSLVRSFAEADRFHGGAGATEVWLSDW
jgi:DNA mismatch repair protein MutS2